MLYRILRILCRLTINVYFRRVKIHGKEKIPKEGPYIFVANHPSAFMDPVIIGSVVKPKLYFLAAGEYMGKGFQFWFLKRFLQMIPVYRPSTRPEETHKNKDMFKYCFEHMSAKKALLVFPEGVSVTEKNIKPLKTGVARIARGSEILHNLELGIKIIPIGLNYSDPHQFRSDLFVNIGDPILASDYITINEEAEVEEVQKLTEVVEESMRASILDVKNEDIKMLTKLDAIYSRDLKKELGITFDEQEREFKMHKDMIAAIEYFQKHDVKRYNEIDRMIDSYMGKLYRHGIRDKAVLEKSNYARKIRITSFILGLPFFILGIVNNIIPYFLVEWVVRKLKIKGTFVGSIILASGLFIYLFWYALATTAIVLFTPLKFYGLLYPLIMYMTGVYALIYKAASGYSRERRKFRSFKKNENEIYRQLIEERENIIQHLEESRKIFETEVKVD